jgi:hypothetical protein
MCFRVMGSTNFDYDKTGFFTTGVPRVADTVPAKFRQALIEASLADAQWLRLPPPRGRCRLTGLSRTTLIELGERGLIKLIRLRKREVVRGIVLISKESLLSHLGSIRPAGEKEEGNAE